MISDPGHQNNDQPGPPVLGYQASVPPRRGAAWVRTTMLIVAIAAISLAGLLVLNPELGISDWLGGGTLGTPFAPVTAADAGRDHPPSAYMAEALTYLAIFLITQWLFLCPRGSWRIGLSLEGPPPRRAALAAGFIGMLLSIGVLATLMEIPDWWLSFTAEGKVRTDQHYAVMWVIIALVWTAWTVVFHSYWHSLDRYTALRKVFRWLVAGTMLEMLLAAPAHAIVISERGSDCYCERGTWTGVAFGCTAALWLFGPGAFLLYLREKRRRERLI